MSKPVLRLVIMGPPGGGKGTIGKMIADEFGVKVVSTGDALREAVRLRTADGVAAETVMKAGGLVSDQIMSRVLHAMLAQTSSFLLDGYPRTLAQAKTLDSLNLNLHAIFNLEVPIHVLMPRFTSRLVHPQSGRTYNTQFAPPKKAFVDDVSGEPLVRRPDDEPDAVMKRLQIYADTTSPIIEYFRQHHGNKLHLLTCETSKEGFAKVKPIIENLIKSKN